ncbi:MAG: hypothetical protein KGL39_28915 [Patescibacteria group bacterium]|nr:hypothetical protein [Patescibacteria group bacterium]
MVTILAEAVRAFHQSPGEVTRSAVIERLRDHEKGYRVPCAAALKRQAVCNLVLPADTRWTVWTRSARTTIEAAPVSQWERPLRLLGSGPGLFRVSSSQQFFLYELAAQCLLDGRLFIHLDEYTDPIFIVDLAGGLPFHFDWHQPNLHPHLVNSILVHAECPSAIAMDFSFHVGPRNLDVEPEICRIEATLFPTLAAFRREVERIFPEVFAATATTGPAGPG